MSDVIMKFQSEQTASSAYDVPSSSLLYHCCIPVVDANVVSHDII